MEMMVDMMTTIDMGSGCGIGCEDLVYVCGVCVVCVWCMGGVCVVCVWFMSSVSGECVLCIGVVSICGVYVSEFCLSFVWKPVWILTDLSLFQNKFQTKFRHLFVHIGQQML